ncbi:hypothetical protein ACWEU6_05225 [Streptosporangium sandarakinum]|uniref:hypothetical protein n=1 Tax=Streptosporangium sandarakinum TaxID=1260955 RepID=UPI00368A976C
MSSHLIHLLIEARQAGLDLVRGPEGKLIVRGPRTAGSLVRRVLDRKDHILHGYVDFYSGKAGCLNWRTAAVSERAKCCVLCGRWSILRDPIENRPMHKVCAENSIRPTRQEAT